MNSTHIHLLLNHFPIIGTLIGTILLSYGIWKKQKNLQHIAASIVFVMALIAIPVFLTGEPAEESVENLPGINETLIEDHEESAEIAFWFMMAAGAVSLISLLLHWTQNSNSHKMIVTTLLLCLVTSAMMIRTGYLGGQIRHTEIRGDAPAGQTAPAAEQGGENEEED